MSPAKIVRIVGVVVVLATALVPNIPAMLGGVALAIVGLVVGYYTDSDDRTKLYLTVVVLASGAQGALNDIPAIGSYLTAILTDGTAMLAAAAVTAVVTSIYERLTE